MKKLLSLLGAVGLVATSGATVISCGSDPTSNSKDDYDITKLIDHTDLGFFKTKEDANEDNILSIIQFLSNNSGIDVKITDLTDTGATITGSGKYTGTVNITFKVGAEITKSDVVASTTTTPDYEFTSQSSIENIADKILADQAEQNVQNVGDAKDDLFDSFHAPLYSAQVQGSVKKLIDESSFDELHKGVMNEWFVNDFITVESSDLFDVARSITDTDKDAVIAAIKEKMPIFNIDNKTRSFDIDFKNNSEAEPSSLLKHFEIDGEFVYYTGFAFEDFFNAGPVTLTFNAK